MNIKFYEQMEPKTAGQFTSLETVTYDNMSELNLSWNRRAQSAAATHQCPAGTDYTYTLTAN